MSTTYTIIIIILLNPPIHASAFWWRRLFYLQARMELNRVLGENPRILPRPVASFNGKGVAERGTEPRENAHVKEFLCNEDVPVVVGTGEELEDFQWVCG